MPFAYAPQVLITQDALGKSGKTCATFSQASAASPSSKMSSWKALSFTLLVVGVAARYFA